MQIVRARRSEDFFEGDGYPVHLGAVEARDGVLGVIRFLEQRLPGPPARVVDLGCGHGRHAGPLTASGYEVTGVDLSRECALRTRERFPAVQVHHGDMAALPFPTGYFDASYSIYSSIGEHGHSIASALSEAARITRVGGTLIVDVANYVPTVRIFGEAVPGGWAIGLRARARYSIHQRNLVLSRTLVGLYRLEHERAAPRLQNEAARAGWDVIEAWGDFTCARLHPRSPRLVIRAVRR
jgi:SAM-dependent methyltransferase